MFQFCSVSLSLNSAETVAADDRVNKHVDRLEDQMWTSPFASRCAQLTRRSRPINIHIDPSSVGILCEVQVKRRTAVSGASTPNRYRETELAGARCLHTCNKQNFN